MRIKSMLFAAAFLTTATVPAQAEVIVKDVAQFYKVYDAANGKPDAIVLQRDYLNVGSQGLHDFIPYRIISAEKLAEKIAKTPSVYEAAKTCVPALTPLEKSAPELIGRIKALYPAATDPRVTVVIGRANSGGTTTPESGVILGLEVVCENRTNSEFSFADRLTYILAHELIHTQQRGYAGDTVLAYSLNEGIADFMGELISGHQLNTHLPVWVKGREAEYAARFRADMDKSDFSQWLYNGVGTPDKPGDLGYWVGYTIAKAYYDRTPDKKAAIKRLLEETDAKAMLRDSGW